MKIYIACHDRWAAQHFADRLSNAGFSVVSTWHFEDFNPTETYVHEVREKIASRDVDEIMRCDTLVLIAGPDRYPGGKFVEAGIAFGLNKQVVIVGRRENMLLHHPRIRDAKDVHELIHLLGRSP